jgi:hypothetical protein
MNIFQSFNYVGKNTWVKDYEITMNKFSHNQVKLHFYYAFNTSVCTSSKMPIPVV